MSIEQVRAAFGFTRMPFGKDLPSCKSCAHPRSARMTQAGHRSAPQQPRRQRRLDLEGRILRPLAWGGSGVVCAAHFGLVVGGVERSREGISAGRGGSGAGLRGGVDVKVAWR